MFKINNELGLKLILIFALLNSAIFVGFHPGGGMRLFIALLLNASAMLLCVFFYKLAKVKFDTGLYFRVLFILLIIWSIFTNLRELSSSTRTLITLFGHQTMAWAWMTPLAIVFGFNIFNWVSLYRLALLIVLAASFLSIGSMVYDPSIVFGLSQLMAFLPILLFLFFLQNNANRAILIIPALSYIFQAFAASQRANIILLLLVVLILIFEIYKKSLKKITKIIISHSVILASIVLAVMLSSIVSSISDSHEASNDTRTFLYEELFDDMSNFELLVGRGALGTYYSPYFAYTEEHGLPGDASTRASIEVGYLQMILKGGYILLALYLLVLLPAAYLGIFHSNNIIAKMCGYYIFLHLILWLVTYYPSYSPEFILLWMTVGTALSESARKISDFDLAHVISTKK